MTQKIHMCSFHFGRIIIFQYSWRKAFDGMTVWSTASHSPLQNPIIKQTGTCCKNCHHAYSVMTEYDNRVLSQKKFPVRKITTKSNV